MAKPLRLPRINRVDFYRCDGLEFLKLLANAVRRFAGDHPRTGLSHDHAALLAWAGMHADVPNGGFTQFFYNNRGDVGVEEASELLVTLDLPKAAAIVRDTLAVYQAHRAAFDIDNPFDGLFGSIAEFEKLDQAFYRTMLRAGRAVQAWARANASALFTGDDDSGPIDPAFTGTVEVRWDNGRVRQSLEVRRGKPSGAYVEFFDDGTVRQRAIYKAGKLTDDVWSNGRPRMKAFNRGLLRVIEWYYESGALQKRFVGDKNYRPTEPVRLYHESGQLAEEQHGHGFDEQGPWLKFFEDGSPRLVAEVRTGEGLVVHEAWDDDRRQTVTHGCGVFHDDGRRIMPWYALFFESEWSRTVELRDGRAHGKGTTWVRRVLWSVEHYDGGQLHGNLTTYYDNGRVRNLTRYEHGAAADSRDAPKFDDPRPAVLLSAEADERLYAAWRHPRVDEYPRPLNLPEVQAKLTVPDMLREVFERNLTGTLRSQYENLNTFKDGITYFVDIDEAGQVRDARPNGSGLCSGGLWGTYQPSLRELRFSPALVNGRAIRCRVAVRVDHTFVEAAVRPPG